jgi:hypothetical protein
MKRKPKPGSSGNRQQHQDDDDDEFELEDADLTKITGSLTDVVNAAVTAQLGRKLGPALTAALPGALKPIQDQLATLIGAGGQQPGAGGAPAGGQQPGAGGQQPQPGAGGAPAGGGQVSPEMQAMQRELAELKAQAAKRDADLKAAAQREREGKRDTALAEQLAKAGVDKNRVRGATAVLRDSMVWEDGADNGKGGWVYRVQRDGYHEDLDVAKGVAEWAGTDEGKSYIAPQQGRGGGPNFGGAGSGARPGQGGQRIGGAGTAPGANPKQERVRQAEANLGPLVAEMLGGGSISITGGSGSGGS